jgi:hypothetical protein
MIMKSRNLDWKEDSMDFGMQERKEQELISEEQRPQNRIGAEMNELE